MFLLLAFWLSVPGTGWQTSARRCWGQLPEKPLERKLQGFTTVLVNSCWSKQKFCRTRVLRAEHETKLLSGLKNTWLVDLEKVPRSDLSLCSLWNRVLRLREPHDRQLLQRFSKEVSSVTSHKTLWKKLMFAKTLMFQSDSTLFRGLKHKKGPRKRVPGRILNFSMWCQLFFQTNSWVESDGNKNVLAIW